MVCHATFWLLEVSKHANTRTGYLSPRPTYTRNRSRMLCRLAWATSSVPTRKVRGDTVVHGCCLLVGKTAQISVPDDRPHNIFTVTGTRTPYSKPGALPSLERVPRIRIPYASTVQCSEALKGMVSCLHQSGGLNADLLRTACL